MEKKDVDIFDATRAGDLDKLLCAINLGGNVNAVNKHSVTPLRVAAIHGFSHCIDLLVMNGAEVNSCNEHGWTALLEAASAGWVDAVKSLIRHGADVHAKSEGSSALHHAMYDGHIDVVEVFIDSGARLEERDGNELTPLGISVRNRDMECARLLVDRGADIESIGECERSVYRELKSISESRKIKSLHSRGSAVSHGLGL